MWLKPAKAMRATIYCSMEDEACGMPAPRAGHSPAVQPRHPNTVLHPVEYGVCLSVRKYQLADTCVQSHSVIGPQALASSGVCK